MKTNSLPQQAQGGESKHTPTPWESESFNGHIRIYRANAGIAVTCGCNGETNAAFIVTACNAHAAHLARIKELQGALQKIVAVHPMTTADNDDLWMAVGEHRKIALHALNMEGRP